MSPADPRDEEDETLSIASNRSLSIVRDLNPSPWMSEPAETRGWASDDVALQKLWLALQRRSWRSMAVLGGCESVDTQWIAELIAKLVWWYRGQPSTVYDLRDLSLRLVDYQLGVVAAAAAQGCAIMALRTTFENPTAIPLARSADAVVLCLEIGQTRLKSAQQTIAEVGAERLLGAIVLRRPAKPARSARSSEP